MRAFNLINAIKNKAAILLIVALFFTGILPSTAQNRNFKFSAHVYTEDSIKITTAAVKVKKLQGDKLLSYSFVNEKSFFQIEINQELADSFYIEIIHKDYLTHRIYFHSWPENDIINSIILLQKVKTLNAVTVKSPYWKSGDTTFYRADAYKKTGDESLEDVIKKIPGFYISPLGELYYLNKKVGKVKIDGVELFVDQVNLLIKNIPQQALETIQAIQNETESQVLKGLDKKTSTNVNIVTKKGAKNHLSGNITLKSGIDSGFLYEYKATILDAVSKIKKGYIGNVGNIGTAAPGNVDLSRTTGFDITTRQKYLPEINQIRNFANLETSDYSRNSIQTHRLQANFPISKKLSLEIKGLLIKDKIEQEKISETKELFENKILDRAETTTSYFKPNLGGINLKAALNLSSKTEVLLALSSNVDHSAGISHNKVRQDDSTFHNSSHNENTARIAKGTFILNKKVKENLGLRISANAAYNLLGQKATNESPIWNNLWNTTDFNALNYEISNKIQFYNTQLDILKKGSQLIQGININWTAEIFSGKNVSYLHAASAPTKDSILPDYTASSTIRSSALNLNFTLKPLFGSLKVIPDFNVGYLNLHKIENGIANFFRLPTYNISFSNNKSYNSKTSGEVTIKLTGNDVDNSVIRSVFYPVSTNSYSRFAGSNIRSNTLSIGYSLHLKPSSTKNYLLFFNFSNDFYSRISRSSYNFLLSETAYDNYAKPSQMVFLSNYYSIFFNKHKLLFRTNNRLVVIKNYTIFKNEIVKSTFLNINQSIELEKSLNFPLLLKWKLIANLFKSYTGTNSLFGINGVNINWYNEFGADLKFNKMWLLNANWKAIIEAGKQGGGNNFISVNMQKQLKKSKDILSISATNLLNTKRLYTFYTDNAIYKNSSYINIPGRSAFISYKFLFNK